MKMRKLLAAAILSASCLLVATSGWAYVVGPTSPGKWGSPVFGTGATVSWSLIPSGVSCSPDCVSGTFSDLSSFMSLGFLTEIQNAFAAWSAVADLTFVQVADSGTAFNAAGALGDIRLGGHVFDGPSGILAHGYYPPVNGTSAAGDIHFDVADAWKIGFGGPGFDIFTVMAHEIGHAIGLDHTAVPGSLMNPFYTEAFLGLQADDIAGGQFIYGVAAIPEPEIYAMMGLGLALMGFVARRRRPQVAD